MSVGFDLRGKGAVVTGGSQGIGLAIVEALLASGAEVHLFDLKAGASSGAIFHQVDVADGAGVSSAVAKLPANVCLLVNNAGITRDKSLLKMTDGEWREVLDVNLTGAFNLIRSISPLMREAGYGRIVNITSINGMRGKFGQANYAAAKAGLIGLTKTAARELGPKGITVNAVAPGMVLTEMALTLAEEVRRRALSETVLNRLAEPRDVADAVLFLLSDRARMITGEVLRVDAGQYI
jgi:3-oxoacyl-[acyl-carrier protein] reductase